MACRVIPDTRVTCPGLSPITLNVSSGSIVVMQVNAFAIIIPQLAGVDISGQDRREALTSGSLSL